MAMTEETRELIITGSSEPVEADPVVDGEAAADVQPVDVTVATEPVATYRAPRSKWDFTDGQRIVIGILIWLNIIVLVIGYLALTGQLSL